MSNDGNVYDKAREVLRERGWNPQGVGFSEGPTCLMGALAVAVEGDVYAWQHISDAVCRPVARAIREQFPETKRSGYYDADGDLPWWFNDYEAKSSEDVDLVLDKAARAWDEQHSGGAA